MTTNFGKPRLSNQILKKWNLPALTFQKMESSASFCWEGFKGFKNSKCVLAGYTKKIVIMTTAWVTWQKRRLLWRCIINNTFHANNFTLIKLITSTLRLSNLCCKPWIHAIIYRKLRYIRTTFRLSLSFLTLKITAPVRHSL